MSLMLSRSPFRARIAALTIVSLVASPMAQLLAQAPTTTPPAAAKPSTTAKPATATAKPQPATTTPKPAGATPAAAAAKPAPPPPDGGWPRAYTTASGATLVIYQPQVGSWTDQKQLVLFAAVSYTARGATKPALGTVKLEANSSVALDERLVSFSDLKLADPSFPTISRDQLKTVVDELLTTVSLQDRVIGLDRVLANVDTSQIIPKNVDGVKAEPPPIFFSKTPAVMMNLDGDPIWAPIPQNDLSSAVNTNWDLFQHNPTKTFYLRNDKSWLKATDVKGPWTPAGDLPESFKKLPEDGNWAEVKANLPGKKIGGKDVPMVYVSTTPAELLLLKGEPSYVAVTGAPTLLWVSNTDSDVFRMGLKGPVYILLAGRWFSAPDFTGPWTFATLSLPDDFKKIPLEHARSRVLASVPGTRQATEAILLAQIPQTARVSKTLQAPEVTYQGGTPEFQPIEKTTVQRAVNTDKDILKVGDLYYMCFQGVWFMSSTPTGPWKVTGDVPKAIYEIPISSPSYNVTYVTVEDNNDDAVVFATAMAATGMMIAFGCVVWGSGYYYPTYGYGAAYNPWTGAYSRSAVAYGPYGGAGVTQRYNPRTGTYSRGAVAYGPYGASGAASAYNPRTGTSAATRQGSNVYGSWGSTAVQRGDSWAQTSRVTNNATGNTTRVTTGSGGGAAVSRNTPGPGGGTVVRTGSGDVYAGSDGSVYRKSGDTYQKSDGSGGWNNTAQQPGDVQRDAAARSEGATRTKDAGSIQSGASSRTGSYRASPSSTPSRSSAPTRSAAPRSGGGGGGRRR